MKIIDEFKQFAMRGSVIDLAVGVVVGGGFGKIVTSFVNDILMPPIGLLAGGINFTELKLTLKGATDTNPAVTLNYGAFIQTTIDFIIIAFCIFLLVKTVNVMRRKEEKKENSIKLTKTEELLTEIRNVLQKKED